MGKALRPIQSFFRVVPPVHVVVDEHGIGWRGVDKLNVEVVVALNEGLRQVQGGLCDGHQGHFTRTRGSVAQSHGHLEGGDLVDVHLGVVIKRVGVEFHTDTGGHHRPNQRSHFP